MTAKATEKIWCYQLNVERNIGKSEPLNENDLSQFIKLIKKKQINDNSWILNMNLIDKETFDLSIKNPNIVEEVESRSPQEIISEIENLDKQSMQALKKIKDLV